MKNFNDFFVTGNNGIASAPLNGQRANDAASWLTYEGGPLNFFNWFPGEPAAGDTIKTIASGASFMTALPNSAVFPGYICEIP